MIPQEEASQNASLVVTTISYEGASDNFRFVSRTSRRSGSESAEALRHVASSGTSLFPLRPRTEAIRLPPARKPVRQLLAVVGVDEPMSVARLLVLVPRPRKPTR
jgi:hypothetical protein